MHEYLADHLVRIGLGILVIGSGPLLAIILLAEIGVWPDPNPNPIGPGLLFFLVFGLASSRCALAFGGPGLDVIRLTIVKLREQLLRGEIHVYFRKEYKVHHYPLSPLSQCASRD